MDKGSMTGIDPRPAMDEVLAFVRSLFPGTDPGQVCLVGGIVRDALLGRSSQDIDLVGVIPEPELHRAGFRLVEGKTTAPVWFRYDRGHGKIELTQLPDGATLHDDLQRRDFTINAIAMSLSGEVTDPLNGAADLRAGLLRACSEETFLRDPLRIFRAFRFEADGWRMTEATSRLLRDRDWSSDLRPVPVERFSREMLKALSAKEPDRFFLGLYEFNVGREWLAELFAMSSIPAGPAEYHPEGDLLSHSLAALRHAAVKTPDPLARFCALFHDIGKLSTDPVCHPRHHGHDESGFHTAAAFCDRLCLPARYRAALSWTSRLHMHLNRWEELRTSTRIRVAAQAAKAGIASILPTVAMADRPGTASPSGWEKTLHVAAMNTSELGIEPDRLAGMPADRRGAYILQRRVEFLRASSR